MSKALFWVAATIVVGEMFVAFIIGGATWNSECDTHLNIWLMGYGIKSAVALPMLIYEHRHASDQPELDFYARRGYQTVKLFVELVAMMWFVLGNSYVWGSHTCLETAPVLYKTSFAVLVLNYIRFGMPLLLCVAVVLCFPCVYMILRRVLTAPREDAVALQKAVNDVPLARYTSGMYSADDANCIICTENYVEAEDLRVLACHHHFHKRCLDPWLLSNPVCPLCRTRLPGAPVDESANFNGSNGAVPLLPIAQSAVVIPVSSSDDGQHDVDVSESGASSRYGPVASPAARGHVFVDMYTALSDDEAESTVDQACTTAVASSPRVVHGAAAPPALSAEPSDESQSLLRSYAVRLPAVSDSRGTS